MSWAFTFPGQGSQVVGMGKELADAFPAARAVFEEVDDALGQKLSTIIWEGSDEDLTLTANTQPALMAVSLSIVRALESEGFVLKDKVAYVAGHSLGEYSALAAAGAFSIADTARLLRIRGEAMQAAVPVGEGAMAAIIGLERDQVDTICNDNSTGGVCQIANDNGAGQLVISGSKANIEAAAQQASEMGAKRARLLPVSAPFHSALMAPAADAMKTALAEVDIQAPCVPLVANVAAGPVTDPAEIADLLVRQVTGQVRWRESVGWLDANSVTEIFEIGAGKVLTGLARRIAPDMTAKPVNTPQDIAELANQ
ncbi:ACP S-malonyltransferase [Hoeflea sp. WL0058]|uniref:Malonyl CoA-acyl carrier protein transacylase n=1 Tax=Flavimaribacter sediminis TaxID=2865987 RepID=A0AAE2ZRN5_9HYPH|nr:ACP S-malonyltransferase [Flavimaribacter sediminis]MBW8639625.1 ACP S-malonyltransferase [Flavimaribacter sediminis]